MLRPHSTKLHPFQRKDIGIRKKSKFTGRWANIENQRKFFDDLANKLKEDEKTTKLLKIFVLTIIATIDMRRGKVENVLAHLVEAKEKAFETVELQRIIPAMAAFLEYEWIMGSHICARIWIRKNQRYSCLSMLNVIIASWQLLSTTPITKNYHLSQW